MNFWQNTRYKNIEKSVKLKTTIISESRSSTRGRESEKEKERVSEKETEKKINERQEHKNEQDIKRRERDN